MVPDCFCCGLFLWFVRCPWVLGWSLNGSTIQDKQTAGLPHNWLMSWTINLAALCDMWSWKWHQWTSFGCFQCGRSLCLLLRGSLPLPPSTPIEILVALATPAKNFKMAGNSVSYPFNSWCMDRLWIAIESWKIACKHLFSFLRYNTLNN